MYIGQSSSSSVKALDARSGTEAREQGVHLGGFAGLRASDRAGEAQRWTVGARALLDLRLGDTSEVVLLHEHQKQAIDLETLRAQEPTELLALILNLDARRTRASKRSSRDAQEAAHLADLACLGGHDARRQRPDGRRRPALGGYLSHLDAELVVGHHRLSEDVVGTVGGGAAMSGVGARGARPGGDQHSYQGGEDDGGEAQH